MTLIPLKEHELLPPKKGKTLTERESEIVKKLENLELTQEDSKLKQALQEKNILTITSDPLKNGLRMSTQSQIGVAQFSNFVVAISPKFSNIDNLVALIDYVYDLDLEIFPESETRFEGEKNILSEIIISSFVKKCKKLLREGLVKSYVTHEDNLSFLRGKLLLKQQILNDFEKKIQFACEHDELEYNNLENQIVLFCLERCYYTTINDSRKKEIRQLTSNFSDLVDRIEINKDDFRKLNYHQMNQHYKKIHELCKLIVGSIKITDFYHQKTRFVNSFFVNMNEVFEKFVFKLFNDFYALPSKEQQRRHAWITEVGKEKFDIIPDILIYDTNKEVVQTIIDSKYKEELSEGDRFQIAFYIRDYNKKEGYAILPEYPESHRDTIKAPQQDIEIKIRYLNIDKTLKLLAIKDMPLRKKEIRKMLEEKIPI